MAKILCEYGLTGFGAGAYVHLPINHDFFLLFGIAEVSSFRYKGYYSPIHQTDGLQSPPKD